MSRSRSDKHVRGIAETPKLFAEEAAVEARDSAAIPSGEDDATSISALPRVHRVSSGRPSRATTRTLTGCLRPATQASR